jgi:hypothetical protein
MGLGLHLLIATLSADISHIQKSDAGMSIRLCDKILMLVMRAPVTHPLGRSPGPLDLASRIP